MGLKAYVVTYTDEYEISMSRLHAGSSADHIFNILVLVYRPSGDCQNVTLLLYHVTRQPTVQERPHFTVPLQ